MSPFQNKVVIITGAASGIGKVLCQDLAKAGAILVMADIQAESLQILSQELKAEAHVLDVSDYQQVKELIEKKTPAKKTAAKKTVTKKAPAKKK